MSVDTTPEARPLPEPAGDASSGGWRHRRWLRRTVLALVLAIALAAVAGLIWAQHYQPLALGSGQTGVTSDDVRVVDDTNALGAQYTIVRPTGGDVATAHVTIWVDPDAPYGVTVEDVGIPGMLVGDPTHSGFLDSLAVTMRGASSGGEQPLVPFASVTLSPGESLDLELAMTFAACNRPAPGRTSSLTAVPLTYRALGMTHHIEMPLGYALAIRGVDPCGVG